MSRGQVIKGQVKYRPLVLRPPRARIVGRVPEKVGSAAVTISGRGSILQFDPGAQSSGSRFATIDLSLVSGTELPSARKNQVSCQDLLTDPFGPLQFHLFPEERFFERADPPYRGHPIQTGFPAGYPVLNGYVDHKDVSYQAVGKLSVDEQQVTNARLGRSLPLVGIINFANGLCILACCP
jgi:hypothetical protein